MSAPMTSMTERTHTRHQQAASRANAHTLPLKMVTAFLRRLFNPHRLAAQRQPCPRSEVYS